MAPTTPRSVALSVAPLLGLTWLFGLTACQGDSAPGPTAESTVTASPVATPAPVGDPTASSLGTVRPPVDASGARMNLTEIAAGDYSSIGGTWHNGQGFTLTIGGDVATISGGPATIPPGTLRLRQLELTDDGSAGFLALLRDDPLPEQPNEPAFVLLPAGHVAAHPCSADIGSPMCPDDRTDTSRDRLTVQTEGGFELWADPIVIPMVYYRAE